MVKLILVILAKNDINTYKYKDSSKCPNRDM